MKTLDEVVCSAIEEHLKNPPVNIQEMREKFIRQSEEVIRHFLQNGRDYSVNCWVPVDYELRQFNNKVEVWFVSDSGDKYKAKSFRCNRLARKYGKRSWKHTLVTDLKLNMPVPNNYIKIDFTVPSSK